MSVQRIIADAQRTELDAIELLMQDQREVECLLREFEYLHKRREETGDVVKVAVAELKMHDTLNTEFFLPAVLEAAGEPGMQDLLASIEEAQQVIRDLIVRVEHADTDREERDAQFSVLARHVGRHFNEAETQVFPRAKQLERLDLASVADQMKARKNEILAEI